MARQAIGPTLRHPDLLRLDISIFILHAVLMASFVALPLAFVERGGLPKEQHWWVYLTALFISFCNGPVHHLRRKKKSAR